MFKIHQKGDFKNTEKFLKSAKDPLSKINLDKYGIEGVRALSEATPRDTGKTAASWSYQIVKTRGSTRLVFNNSNINSGVNIAILLQYGHGTRNGGYVIGRDYINPAVKPVFDRLAEEAWKEVRNA